jgi:hypothetical protein
LAKKKTSQSASGKGYYRRYDFGEDMEDVEVKDDEEDFNPQELEALYDMLDDFPELDELDGILDMDDEDFYTKVEG